MAVIIRFLLRDPTRELYWNEKTKTFSAYVAKATTWKTYEEAEKAISGAEEGFYQIDKIFKVTK